MIRQLGPGAVRLARLAAAAAIAVAAVAACTLFARVLGADGWQPLDWPLLALFVPLAVWSATSCAIGLLGTALLAGRRLADSPAGTEPSRAGAAGAPRTALVMPVYNEDPGRVFAALAVMRRALAARPDAAGFEIFVLSDTTDPARQDEELAAWRRLRRAEPAGPPVFYRHRPRNVGRKAGNIAEFCRRWGGRYAYMTVLDADSLMTAGTLVAMVARMEADPRIGILQVPPRLINAETGWGRLLQFADALYGPMVAAGLNLWSGREGNYWGHNAIIRVEAFAANCALPTLPGRPPLGGEILSHDFVEAALIRRGGWHVRIADDLGGSYEEAPPTLPDFLKRDRRWCQGNLQHMAMLRLRGVHPINGFHFAVGIMSYVASPILTLFVALGLVEGYLRVHRPVVYFSGTSPTPVWPVDPRQDALALLWLSAAFLLLPKLLRWLLVLADRRERARFGGAWALSASALTENLLSVLTSPVLLLFHTRFVIEILSGRSVGWGSQRRQAGTPAGDILRLLAPHTAIGLLVGAVAWHWLPDLFWYLSPLVAGLCLAIPTGLLGASPAVGRALARAGLLGTPEELAPVPEIAALRRLGAAPERPADLQAAG
ncbi:MAG: glucans biosynthesis glucosyltransferase MdoH [Dongiaceae bacterium]